MLNITELYHRLLKKPYKLAVTSDIRDNNLPVLVLLHGIASDSSTWDQLLPLVKDEYRVVAIDLLGFGLSPKPTNESYSLTNHSKSIVYTLKKLGIKKDITIIGHSMGGLISIDIAHRHPRLVKKIITTGMPLYNNDELTIELKNGPLAGKNITNGLFRVYDYLINNQEITLNTAQKFMKISPKISSFILTKETWIPFKKSLKASIMNQDTLESINYINVPIYIIYGSIDIFILSKNYKDIAKTNKNIILDRYIGGHLVSKAVAKKIKKAILTNP